MDKLKPCPFCGESVTTIYAGECDDCVCQCENCDTKSPWGESAEEAVELWNTRPAEDAKDREIEKLKSDLGIQKNLTNQACFESNRAYQETEKWKKMFYDLSDKQSSVSTDPKVIVVATDTNVPTNADKGNMEG